MGKLDDLKPTGRIYTCAVRTLRATLEQADQAKLDAMLADPRWTHNALATALQNKGLPISPNRLQRHRENNCSCSKI